MSSSSFIKCEINNEVPQQNVSITRTINDVSSLTNYTQFKFILEALIGSDKSTTKCDSIVKTGKKYILIVPTENLINELSNKLNSYLE